MAIAELWDADGDYYPVRKFPEAQPCHGQEEFWQFIGGYLDAFPRTDWAIQKLIEVGDDRVLVCVSMRAEGHGSGMKLEGEADSFTAVDQLKRSLERNGEFGQIQLDHAAAGSDAGKVEFHLSATLAD